MFDVTLLPTINAALNTIAACLLTLGLYFIRRREISRHRLCMGAAFATSVLFLVSYLVYHAQVGSKPFLGEGWIRPVYFSVLLTHTALAAAVPPLAIITLSRALGRRFDRHRAIAKWTLPIWLYVSVTGVIVYLMLYHL